MGGFPMWTNEWPFYWGTSRKSWMGRACTSTYSTTTSQPSRSAIGTHWKVLRRWMFITLIDHCSQQLLVVIIRFRARSSGSEPKMGNLWSWSRSGNSSGTLGQRRLSTWSARTTCWSPMRRWRAGAALWGAGIWSSSRTAQAGTAQSRGEFRSWVWGRAGKDWTFWFWARQASRCQHAQYISSVCSSPGSGPGRDIQRVITSHADAAKIGRKIADEVRPVRRKRTRVTDCQRRCRQPRQKERGRGWRKEPLPKNLVRSYFHSFKPNLQPGFTPPPILAA